MATYIVLVDFTENGIRNVQETTKRASELSGLGKSLEISLKDVYWTSGAHDGVLVFDAPDEKAAAAFMLAIAKKGNVKTQTLRAFDASEMQSIIERMP